MLRSVFDWASCLCPLARKKRKLAEGCVLANEKRGRVPLDDKEKSLVARHVEEGRDEDFWRVCKEEGRGG